MRTSSKIGLGIGAGVGIFGVLLATILIIFGIVLSLSIIGAIIGIPLILFGIAILTGSIGFGTLMGAGVAMDESIDDYYKKKEKICTYCGAPLETKTVHHCQKRHFRFGRGFDHIPICNNCAKKCKLCVKYFCPKHINDHKC